MIRYRQSQEEDLQLNMAPLIDMVFLLIIFFLTVTSFTQEEREQEVLLPSNSNPRSLSREADQKLIVNVMRDGAIRFGGRPTTGTELSDLLKDRRERSASPLKVLVRADRHAEYGNVAAALVAVERAGVQRPFIITRWLDLGE